MSAAGVLLAAGTCFAAGGGIGVFRARTMRRLTLATLTAVAGYWVVAAGFLEWGDWPLGIWFTTLGVWLFITTWRRWRRGRRKRAAKLIGEKGRLVRAALVRTMRERAKPRPVYRPGRLPA